MTTSVLAQVERLVSRSHAIVAESLRMELLRAITCCRIGRHQGSVFDMLHYLLVAEETSARFKKLDLQSRSFGSDQLLELVGRLEEELGGRAENSIRDVDTRTQLGSAVLKSDYKSLRNST